jgi:hypothetical protein
VEKYGASKRLKIIVKGKKAEKEPVAQAKRDAVVARKLAKTK